MTSVEIDLIKIVKNKKNIIKRYYRIHSSALSTISINNCKTILNDKNENTTGRK